MLGKRLLSPRGGVLVCALLLAACDAYDPKLLRYENPNPPPPVDSGMPHPDVDGGHENDSGPPICVKMDEICNDRDDDCDGKTDEDTKAYCESVIVNAKTTCAQTQMGASCVKLGCLDGFADCDGKPQTGCEAAFCDCNDCPDGGSEDGGT